ncbi:phosphotransferase [Sinimarinibacterium sp. HSW-8]|uniref:Phosphotransferase n=2 Tax=Sinimarinibacterium thermocellulolyticum TaxID=3170016 RepID=A0ABV2A796_9GAMM
MPTAASDPAADVRAETARCFALQRLGLADARFAPASADASFRRYFRIEHGAQSWIVMDAPPERENLAPFIRVGALMQAAGLHVPKILAEDRAQGLLLLDDLGRHTYLQVLNADNADALMADAIDALIRWQCASRPGVLPIYDEALLRRELDLFADWYVGRELGRTLDAQQRGWLRETERRLLDSALAQPRVWVHRDYMPRNLMLSDPNPGVLDFQDAVEGPISYDLASLMRDAFVSWPAERIDAWMRLYWERARGAGLPVGDDFSEFRRAADWMALQRHLKVIGIFARICHRDGKPHYLADVPRFIGYVRELGAHYAEMAPLLRLFDSLDLHAP